MHGVVERQFVEAMAITTLECVPVATVELYAYYTVGAAAPSMAGISLHVGGTKIDMTKAEAPSELLSYARAKFNVLRDRHEAQDRTQQARKNLDREL